MLSKKNALVLLWTGNDLPEKKKKKIANVLTTYTGTQRCNNC